MDNSISLRNKLAKKVQYVKWTEKEENYLLEAILEAVEKGVRVDNRKCIKGIEELQDSKDLMEVLRINLVDFVLETGFVS